MLPAMVSIRSSCQGFKWGNLGTMDKQGMIMTCYARMGVPTQTKPHFSLCEYNYIYYIHTIDVKYDYNILMMHQTKHFLCFV